MYKQLKHVLTGITGQFTERELEQLVHGPLNPRPQCITHSCAEKFCGRTACTDTRTKWLFMPTERLNVAAECRDCGDPVSITRLLPLTPNTPASFLRPLLSSSLTPPLLLLLSAESQSSPLISTMLSVAGVSELFSGILITPRGVRRPSMLGAQQEMSSGGEPPTVATESGKLLSPQ